MKGQVFMNNYGRLTIKGEDSKFYMINKTSPFNSKQAGDVVEFEPATSEYNGKTQLWANPAKGNMAREQAPDLAAPTNPTATQDAQANNSHLIRLLNGIGQLLAEQKETNKLLGELLAKKTAVAPAPVVPTPTYAPTANMGDIKPLPF